MIIFNQHKKSTDMLLKVFPHSQTLGPWALFLCPTDKIPICLQMIVKGVFVICVSKYFCPNYCHPGHEEEWGEWQENTLRAPAAHRRHLPGILSLVRRLRFCHDWNLSTETRDTWPLLRTCSATCRHVLTVIGTLWSANNSWTLNTELENWHTRQGLIKHSRGLGKKRKVCFNLLLHLHFDICGQFLCRIWQMSVPVQQRIVCFV